MHSLEILLMLVILLEVLARGGRRREKRVIMVELIKWVVSLLGERSVALRWDFLMDACHKDAFRRLRVFRDSFVR